MANETMLLIDDDAVLRELLAEHLQAAHYRVINFHLQSWWHGWVPY